MMKFLSWLNTFKLWGDFCFLPEAHSASRTEVVGKAFGPSCLQGPTSNENKKKNPCITPSLNYYEESPCLIKIHIFFNVKHDKNKDWMTIVLNDNNRNK